MAQVVEIKTACGIEIMYRGKIGDQVFQVRNGKQVVTQIPKPRTSLPSEKEARRLVAEKHGIKPRQVYHCFVWYFQEAKRRHIPIPDLDFFHI